MGDDQYTSQPQPLKPLPPSRAEMESQIFYRAIKDEQFRNDLLADPAGLLEREYGDMLPWGKVPEGVQIQVLMETKQTRYLVIPWIPDSMLKEEVPEEDLKRFASDSGCIDLTYTEGGCTEYTCPGTYWGECTCIMCES